MISQVHTDGFESSVPDMTQWEPEIELTGTRQVSECFVFSLAQQTNADCQVACGDPRLE